MKYSVDKIEDNIVRLENIETKEILEINISELPNNIKEGTIILKKDNTYLVDTIEENERRTKINSLFDKLKK